MAIARKHLSRIKTSKAYNDVYSIVSKLLQLPGFYHFNIILNEPAGYTAYIFTFSDKSELTILDDGNIYLDDDDLQTDYNIFN